MSLAVLAQHMASKGRNGDSMLVHMTPGEVHGLHALAVAHGGKITINPETGLPEANFLKKLLPMIAGAALNFFAPGIGTAIGSALGGLSGAAGTAIAVGGITGLATGSLQKGLMAGLGAYGGAGLTDALLGGAGAAGAAGALGVEGAATGAGSQAAMLAEQTAGFGGEGLQRLAESAGYAKGATPSLSAAFSAGADAAMKNPGAFLKGATKPLMYAAAPIMADAMVPTTTEMPNQEPGATGYIRPKVNFDPRTGTFESLAPIAANRIQYPYPPPGGAAGGLVALANGGVARFADGGWQSSLPSDWSTYDAQKKIDWFNQKAISPEMLRSAGVGQSDLDWMKQQGYVGGVKPELPSNIATYTPEQKADLYNTYLSKGIQDAAIREAAGAATDSDWKYLQDLAAKRGSPAVSGAERYALTTPGWQSTSGLTGLAGLNANVQQWFADRPNATYKDIERAAQEFGVDTQDIIRGLEAGGGSKAMQYITTTPAWQARSGETGLLGMSSNINRWIAEHPNATRAEVYNEMEKWGLNAADIKRATGKTVEELYPLKVAPPPIIEAGTRPGYTGADTTYGGTDVLTPIKLAPLGTAGRVTRGTETMADVRAAVGNRYAPQTFDFTPSVTGASKSAYDYLMGRGEYPVVQKLPDGAPLMRPYFEVAGFEAPALTSVRDTSATTGQIPFGFKPPSTGGFTTGTQRWVNLKTGEKYLAPTGGYVPPSSDWVLEETVSGDANRDTGGGGDAGGDGGDGDGDGDGTGEAKNGGLMRLAMGGYAGGGYNLGSYSDGGRLLRGPGDGVSDSIPATIGAGQPARLADGEFVVPARIVSELGNGSTEAGARKLYAMMDRVQRARRKTTGKGKVAANTKAERFLPA